MSEWIRNLAVDLKNCEYARSGYSEHFKNNVIIADMHESGLGLGTCSVLLLEQTSTIAVWLYVHIKREHNQIKFISLQLFFKLRMQMQMYFQKKTINTFNIRYEWVCASVLM